MAFVAQSSNDQQQTFNRQEEYLQAQRAAVEAVAIGRETLEAAERQGEQLQNADQLATETEYKLDRAGRMLRGMTWSGWLANKLSQDIQAPRYQATQGESPPKVYDGVPDDSDCEDAAQAVQNYHANLSVFESCETMEQIETCRLICNNMHEMATAKVAAICLPSNNTRDVEAFGQRLSEDLTTLHVKQLSMQQHRSLTSKPPTKSSQSEKNSLFEGSKTQATSSSTMATVDPIQQQQDQHLDTMAQHLNELGSLATNLNTSLMGHSDVLETLDGKNDAMLFKSKMVTRRADRLIQKKTWSKVKPEFQYDTCVRHNKSGKYLAVSPNYGLVLSDLYNETCVFHLWKRQGTIVGLKSKYNKRWLGQNLVGSLVCSAYSFSRREEWDLEDNWTSTPLLCASAGWGNGGYVMLKSEGESSSLYIGGGGLDDKKNAGVWSIQEHMATRARNSPK